MRISDGVQTCALPISLVADRAGENGHIAHPGRDFGRDLLYSAQSRPGGVRQCGHHSHSRAIGRPFRARSEEHTSELQSLMRISYAVFCLKKKKSREHKNPIEENYTATHINVQTSQQQMLSH